MNSVLDKRKLMVFGHGLISDQLIQARKPVLFAAPEPLASLRSNQRAMFSDVKIVKSMDLSQVDEMLQGVGPDVELCVGLGGGSALDMAKYTAWKRQLHLILIPSILSVDACVTSAAAVRVDGKVKYVGTVVPEVICIDYDILRQAPSRLNAAGAADILSIHTALFDWQLASERRGEPFNAVIASQARELLSDLQGHAKDIRDNTAEGLKFLAEAFAIEDNLCTQHGNSRPEEGSEHFLAYCVEYFLKRPFIHGELVGFCSVVMAYLQKNDPEYVVTLLEQLGIPFKAAHLNIDYDAFKTCLLNLKAYCANDALPFSIIDDLTGRDIESSVAALWEGYV